MGDVPELPGTPAALVYDCAATVTKLVGFCKLGDGVKIASKMVGSAVVVMFDSTPLPTVTSSLANPIGGSLKLNVTVAVSPVARTLSLIEMETVGTTELTM